MWLGRLEPSPDVLRYVERCDYILVTHAHWDHLLDAPSLAGGFAAPVIGSENTARLMRASGLKEARAVKPGDRLSLGGFNVEVLPAEHERVPGFNGGQLPPRLNPPLTARGYRPDAYYCYRVTACGFSMATDPGVRPALKEPTGALFLQPHRSEGYYRALLGRVRPRLVVPVHWDSLFQHSLRPPESFVRPQPGWPLLKRVDLRKWREMINRLAPGADVVIPRLFTDYEISLEGEGGRFSL